MLTAGVYKRVKKLWTTTDIAELLGVSDKHIRKWIDDGQLKNQVLPGFSERRVHREDLRKFLLTYQYYHALREMDAEESITRKYPDEDEPLPPRPARQPPKTK